MVDSMGAARQDGRQSSLVFLVLMTITLIILAVTCVVSFMALNNGKLLDDLLLWPPAIQRSREYYRLVTYGLVHADFGHLLFNMLTLFFFGRIMESFFTARLGTLGFLLFYMGGLVVSILPTYLKNRSNTRYRSLGASGAVSAVLFAFVLLAPGHASMCSLFPCRRSSTRCSTPPTRSTWTSAVRTTSTTARICGAQPTAWPSRCCWNRGC